MECFSLILRLHCAHFIQNSFYVRNILVQPGPLTHPPALRSSKTPSFRIIDFGRSEYWVYNVEGTKTQVSKDEEQTEEYRQEERDRLNSAAVNWWDFRNFEVKKAQNELMLDDFDY
jgi:hypothetical protein